METKLTNEEKAREIAKRYETPCHGIGDCEFEAYQSALEAMKWKDEQLQSMLNGLSPSIHSLVKAVGEASGINFDNFY